MVHSPTYRRTATLFLVGCLVVGTLVFGYSDDDRGGDHGGGGGVGITIDPLAIFNALSNSGEKKKKGGGNAPAPKKEANDSDCPERYKALVALLASLQYAPEGLADAIKARQDAIDDANVAYQALHEALINELNANMQAARHPDDPTAAKALTDAQAAYEKAKAAYDTAKDAVTAAAQSVADWAKEYNEALDKYEKALAAYNAHCRDYKPGPSFPPYPNGGKVSYPPYPPAPDPNAPASPGGSVPKDEPGKSGQGNKPDGDKNKPGGNTPKPGDDTGKAGGNTNQPGDNNGKTTDHSNKPGDDGKPNGNNNKPGGDNGKTGGADGGTGKGGSTTDGGTSVTPDPNSPGRTPPYDPNHPSTTSTDCSELLTKIIGDLNDLEKLLNQIVALEADLGNRDAQEIVDEDNVDGPDESDTGPSESEESETQKLINQDAKIVQEEHELAALRKEADNLLYILLQEMARYKRHCPGNLPELPSLVGWIDSGPGPTAAGHELTGDCKKLYEEARAAQENLFVQTRKAKLTQYALDDAKQHLRDVEKAAHDAQENYDKARGAADNARRTAAKGGKTDVAGAQKQADQAKDNLQQEQTKLQQSKDYADALADVKAKQADYDAALKAQKEAQSAFDTAKAAFEKHCGSYPTVDVDDDLERVYGPKEPGKPAPPSKGGDENHK